MTLDDFLNKKALDQTFLTACKQILQIVFQLVQTMGEVRINCG